MPKHKDVKPLNLKGNVQMISNMNILLYQLKYCWILSRQDTQMTIGSDDDIANTFHLCICVPEGALQRLLSSGYYHSHLIDRKNKKETFRSEIYHLCNAGELISTAEWHCHIPCCFWFRRQIAQHSATSLAVSQSGIRFQESWTKWSVQGHKVIQKWNQNPSSSHESALPPTTGACLLEDRCKRPASNGLLPP